jgi:hypothetical protein
MAVCLVLAAIVAGPVWAQAPGGRGTVGIRLVDAPRDRADDPRAHVYIVDHLAPGTAISRRVEVRNDTDRPTRVQLYPAGAEVAGGRFRFLDGRTPNELAEWIRVEPAEVTLDPGAAAVANVTLEVPRDATAGERYGMVWAELPAAAGDITLVNRVGVRLYVSVGPGGEPASDFAVGALTAWRAGDGVPVVAARVTNTGGRALDVSGELLLTDAAARLTAGPFAAELGTTLAPGDTAPVEIRLDPALPDGPWEATLTLRSGRLERTVTGQVSFTAVPVEVVPVPAPDRPPVSLSEATGASRALQALAGLLLLAVLLLLLAAWRRRREDVPAHAAG